MAGVDSIVKAISGGTAGVVSLTIYIAIGILICFVLSIIAYFIWQRNKWSYRVEIKLLRSNGKVIFGEWAKGSFDAKKGVFWIKRKGISKVPVPIPDIKRWIQGDDLIGFIQLGPEDYRPINVDSYIEHLVEFENEKGEIIEIKESILNIETDTGHNKPWKSAWDAASKKAYSLINLLQQYVTPISIAIVLIAVFAGFAILWTRLPTICK